MTGSAGPLETMSFFPVRRLGSYMILTGLFGGCVWAMSSRMTLMDALVTIISLVLFWGFLTLALFLIMED